MWEEHAFIAFPETKQLIIQSVEKQTKRTWFTNFILQKASATQVTPEWSEITQLKYCVWEICNTPGCKLLRKNQLLLVSSFSPIT